MTTEKEIMEAEASLLSISGSLEWLAVSSESPAELHRWKMLSTEVEVADTEDDMDITRNKIPSISEGIFYEKFAKKMEVAKIVMPTWLRPTSFYFAIFWYLLSNP